MSHVQKMDREKRGGVQSGTVFTKRIEIRSQYLHIADVMWILLLAITHKPHA